MSVPGPTMYAFNRTRQTFLATQLRVAQSHWSRFRGLMCTDSGSFLKGCGVWLVPSRGVHSFAMRFPIDVLISTFAGKFLAFFWRAFLRNGFPAFASQCDGGGVLPLLVHAVILLSMVIVFRSSFHRATRWRQKSGRVLRGINLACNSYDRSFWAVLKIGKKIGRLTVTNTMSLNRPCR